MRERWAYVASAVERVVEAAVSQFDEVVLDLLALGKLPRINEVRSAELACP